MRWGTCFWPLILPPTKTNQIVKGQDLIAPSVGLPGARLSLVDWQMGAAFADKGVTATLGLVALLNRSVGICERLCSHVTRHITEPWVFQHWQPGCGWRSGWWFSQDAGGGSRVFRKETWAGTLDMGIFSPMAVGHLECQSWHPIALWPQENYSFIHKWHCVYKYAVFGKSSINGK